MEEIEEQPDENLEPFLKFNFYVGKNESEDHLLDVEFEGVRVVNTPMSFYQDIIDFCEKRMKLIPHYDVVDGKLEWMEEKHED